MATKLALKLILAVIPVLLIVAACGEPAPPPAPPPAAPPPVAKDGDVAAGQAVFQQHCEACHPGGGAGVGPALRGQNLSAGHISTQVRQGAGAMPAFPPERISDQQLNDLVAYVLSLQ
jgi:mono/diheme cytochrome c family protein